MDRNIATIVSYFFCFKLYHEVKFGGRRLLRDVVSLKEAGSGKSARKTALPHGPHVSSLLVLGNMVYSNTVRQSQS